MGKKSRRSNRKDRSAGHGKNIPVFLRRLFNLEKEANDNYRNQLYSIAAQKYQEGLQIILQFQDAIFKTACPIDSSGVLEAKATFSLNLIMVEYSRCRYDNVIQIYNDIQMSAENEKVVLSFMCKLHGQLAMLRLDDSKENKERVISLIDTRVSEGMADPAEVAKALEALKMLRNMKEYDAATALGEKLERLSENRDLSTFEHCYSRGFVGLIGDVVDTVIFENSVTHLEQYRVEYHQQKGKVSHNNSLNRVLEACSKIGDVPQKALATRLDAFWMMIAQSHFLCHEVDDKEVSSQLCSNAIEYIETYLETIWHFERHCFTCHQKGTTKEVHLVCSGCRFACYCRLDHQRMTWRKGAIRGMRIGHEILCPLMNAYRKWKLVSKKGNEIASKLRRRFERECMYFLSDGLGLKDKCFEEKDMQKFRSLQNTCK
ncbi:predicted protein [Chaetoceros tenuissimus]|uniref:MYND-type domain-containing protein n=1 Tax=Chaetoceros tenuissimus TaxID=426638 RepID=A0AAD3CFF5_9STRA|nr:predicted protein [Chaetoceros tenuissimus]